jgi:hypothetical protein
MFRFDLESRDINSFQRLGPYRAKNRVASRAHGTEGKNNPAQWGGLDGKKNAGQRRSVFSSTPFMERIRS